MFRSLITFNFVVALAVLALPGCQPGTELEPMAEAPEATVTDDVAVTEMAGITMKVDGGAWQGAAEVEDLVTPVWIEITNAGDAPLYVSYSSFSLVGAVEEYDALPAFEYEWIDGAPVLITGYEPVAEPAYPLVDYYVAPYFSPAYPVVEPWGGVLVYDEDYYGRFATVWRDMPLPTAEMQRSALPEGVLPAGATVSGFLYLEDLAEGEEKVNFMAQLENADTNELMGTIRIPMEPEMTLES